MNSADREAYARAGVDIKAADKAKELIKRLARSTSRPEVLTDIGLFGGMFQLKCYTEPVLVSSVDGVGTKLKIASFLNKHDTIGIDLVNHCVNDVLTCGASPLFFLDYIAMGKLLPQRVESIVSGIAQACKNVGCALVGGETAEMPGIYQGDDYDLVGFIVGGVEKANSLSGNSIASGDIILGLPSSGLHTNGYSLVRKVFGLDRDPSSLQVFRPELKRTLGEELLEPHRCYYSELKPVLPMVKGLAHITGGGFEGNIPRILPQGLAVQISKDAWQVPPIFKLIQERGKVKEAEMYQVFNMGIGMVIFCSQQQAAELTAALPETKKIGKVIKSTDGKKITII
ncbi:MAG: phosphoribosylformylglycinamidine cyclo-ligase [Dehalococcoidia bacterium]|nr:phosphoribosylformylglycinamidine cyclo-ligase [Dehalococcoidia bacterium]